MTRTWTLTDVFDIRDGRFGRFQFLYYRLSCLNSPLYSSLFIKRRMWEDSEWTSYSVNVGTTMVYGYTLSTGTEDSPVIWTHKRYNSRIL